MAECHEAFLGRRLRLARVIRVHFAQGTENLEHHPLNVVLGQWLAPINQIHSSNSHLLPEHSVPGRSAGNAGTPGKVSSAAVATDAGLASSAASFRPTQGGADTSRRAHLRARLIQLNCAQTLTTQALSGQSALQPTRHRGVTRQWRDAFNQSKRAHSQHQPSHPRTCLTPATLSLDLPHIIHPSITRGQAKGKASTARGCGRGGREDARKRVLKRGWTQQTQENSVWGVLYTVGKQAQPPTLVGGIMEPLPSRTMSSGQIHKTLSSKSTLNFTISKNKKSSGQPTLLRCSPV
jgi:hypothetical protein